MSHVLCLYLLSICLSHYLSLTLPPSHLSLSFAFSLSISHARKCYFSLSLSLSSSLTYAHTHEHTHTQVEEHEKVCGMHTQHDTITLEEQQLQVKPASTANLTPNAHTPIVHRSKAWCASVSVCACG